MRFRLLFLQNACKTLATYQAMSEHSEIAIEVQLS
jgi:hypothetical protein